MPKRTKRKQTVNIESIAPLVHKLRVIETQYRTTNVDKWDFWMQLQEVVTKLEQIIGA